MKKVSFGYANGVDPKGSWEGIGIAPNLMILEADYYGTVKYMEDSYMIARVRDDVQDHYKEMAGSFLVKPAVADMYVDGSGIIFLNQEDSQVSMQLQNILNSPRYKERINSIEDVYRNFDRIHQADMTFKYLTMGDEFLTTSITHEEFTKKNEALKKCRMSFSELQQYQMGKENSFSK